MQNAKGKQATKEQLMVDIGFLVTTKHNVEDSKANVDYGVYSPHNKLLQHENGVSEAEIEAETEAVSQGPWKICFRVSGGKLLKPSVIVDITYFSLNFVNDEMEDFEWEDDEESERPDHSELGTHEQVIDLQHGLARIDMYMQNVTNEQRFLYARTVRHLKTAQSTLRRTYWYYFAIYSAICVASLSQVLVIRLMFKKVRVLVCLRFNMPCLITPKFYKVCED